MNSADPHTHTNGCANRECTEKSGLIYRGNWVLFTLCLNSEIPWKFLQLKLHWSNLHCVSNPRLNAAASGVTLPAGPRGDSPHSQRRELRSVLVRLRVVGR